MAQSTTPVSGIPPATLIEAQVLQVTAAQHQANIQAIGPVTRGLGPSIVAAVTPADLIQILASIPQYLGTDARTDRILRGT